MQSPTRPDSEQRAQVDRALIDLCFESGFTELSVEAVCQRAGVDRAAFDRQYDDLEDCFCQMLESERDRFFAYLDRAMIGQERWVDRLRAVAYALLRYLRADERRTHVLTIELYRVGDRATLIWSETIAKRLFALIDEGRSELPDPESLTATTAVSVGGGIFNQLYTAIGRGSSLPAESEIVPQMMYAAVLPYLGAAAAARELDVPPPPRVTPP
jgi:AcrR family transcriptional regulator